MAGSRNAGPLNPLPGDIQFPARTHGPLGINDQADPNVTSLLGDTPGPLGIMDYADPTLPLITEDGYHPVVQWPMLSFNDLVTALAQVPMMLN